MHSGWAVVLLCSGLLAGCSPEFNWREVRLPEIGAGALFPCKPVKQSRAIALGGSEVTWTLHACEAGGVTFALASGGLRDGSDVGRALRDLTEAVRRNLGAEVVRASNATVSGAGRDHPPQRLDLEGRRHDGAPISETALLFVRGTRIYQATVLGGRPSAEVADTFLSSIRIAP